ncbi:DUF6766 family protein [Microvirga ossetica]|nr:DUF6766 family protein [Microvirga ossetica]
MERPGQGNCRHSARASSTLGGNGALTETLADAEFWYKSFQNWQSEVLPIAMLLVLGNYLREHGSPESKPVASPHAAPGH